MKLKIGLISLLLVLMSSCGGQNSPLASNDNTLKTASAEQGATTSKSSSTEVSLMDSLAKLYPNGQLPANRVNQSAKDLAQNPAALKLTAPAPMSKSNIQSQKAGIQQQSMALAADFLPVARIQNTTLEGSYFFSIYDIEIENALISHPDWILEGAAFWASIAAGDGLSPVHRFRNLLNGSYLYTIYEGEKATIIRDYSRTFAYEGVAWHARQTPTEGWTPLYRFRNLTNGTYLFTAYEDEKDFIQIWYADIFALEGVAYYVRLDKPIDPPSPPLGIATSISPTTATLNMPTVFNVTGTNLPLDAFLNFQDAVCQAPVNNTANGFSQRCIPSAAGEKSIYVVIPSYLGPIPRLGSVTVVNPPPELPYIGKLPDTGVSLSQCYSAGSDALISCTSASAIALNPQQDGMVGRDVTAPAAVDGKLGFSYSDVPKVAGGTYVKTECVKDNITGLTWEGKTSTGLHSQSLYYTLGQASTFVAEVNATKLCGYDDWRLPTAVELQSLVDYGVASGDPAVLAPAIDTTWFPNTQDSTYLSSSISFGTPLIVGFSDGWTRGDSGNAYYARLVRGAKITTAFVVSSDGQEVTDTKSGLIWRRCAEGATFDGNTCIGSTEAGGTSYSHEPALARAKSQAISTGLAWRLPNIKELTNLSMNLAEYTAAFPGAPEWLWSSTPQTGDSHSAWAVQKYGAVEASLGNRTVFTFFRMRLVRNAP